MDFSYVYMTQFTVGCKFPNCTNEECFSSSKFKYKNLSSEDLEVISEKYSDTSDHLCPNLSPVVTDPLIIEDLLYFQDFANSIINKGVNVDFDIFQRILLSKNTFSMIFMNSPEYDFTLNDFSFEKSSLYNFVKEAKKIPEKFSPYALQFIELSKSVFFGDQIAKPHDFRSAALILHMLTIFDMNAHLSVISGFVHFLFSRNRSNIPFFYQALINSRELLGYDIATAQNLLTYLLSNEHGLQARAQNPTIIRDIANHLQHIADENINSGFLISSNFFYNDALVQKLNAKTEYRLYSKKKPSILDFPSLLSLSFKQKVAHVLSNNRMKHNSNDLNQNQQQELNNQPKYQPYFSVSVRRDNVLKDMVKILADIPKSKLQKMIRVSFNGEKGQDYGGISQEMFYKLSKEFFSPDNGLFELVNENQSHYYFRQQMMLEDDPRIAMYEIAGTIIGLAIHNMIMLPIRFPTLLYKKLLNIRTGMRDFLDIKPEVARSLSLIQTMAKQGEDVSQLDLRFEITYDTLFGPLTIPLIQNGENIVVDNGNCDNYIDQMLQWELNHAIKYQFRAFKRGMEKVLNENFLKFFGPDELDTIISGNTIYEWERLKESAVYKQGYKKDSPNITLFWKIFDEFTDNQKSDFLLYVTGSKCIPIGGLGKIELEFQKSTETTLLPVAHTCTKMLQLPDYCDEEKMRRNLLICLQCNEGFGVI